jgi:hypothetical protein
MKRRVRFEDDDDPPDYDDFVAERLRTEHGANLSVVVPDWTASLTVDRRHFHGRYGTLGAIDQLLRELEQAAGRPIAWLLAEPRSTRRKIRLRLFVGGVADLDRSRWSRVFRSLGSCRTLPFDDVRGVAFHLAAHGFTVKDWFHFGGGLMDQAWERHGSKPEQPEKILRVCISGRGCRPDGGGSGYAYVVENTGKSEVEWVAGLSREMAVYHGLLRVVDDSAPGSKIRSFVDSQRVAHQFEHVHYLSTSKLISFLARIRILISEQRLVVKAIWLPSHQNPASKLLVPDLKRFGGKLQENVIPVPLPNAASGEIKPPKVMVSDVIRAEMELRAKRERMVAGLKRARTYGTKSGKPIGRPVAVVSVEKIIELRNKGWGWRRIGRAVGVSASTVRRRYLTYTQSQRSVSKTWKRGFGTVSRSE